MSKMKLTQEATVHGIDVAFILLQYYYYWIYLSVIHKRRKNH